jgi:hypothetical protein
MSQNKFNALDCLGFRHFISKQMLKARPEDLLPDGALKIRIKLVIKTPVRSVVTGKSKAKVSVGILSGLVNVNIE